MNLNDFESLLSPEILQRGKAYYTKGNITDLQRLKSGEWISVVDGNYGDYNVEVTIDKDGEVDGYFCNCPYAGEICKHIVAVLFKIKESTSEGKGQGKNESEWEEIIQNAPEQKLREFLFDYAKEDKEFRNALLLHFPPANEVVDSSKYVRMVAQAFKNAAGKYGYIDYRGTYQAIEPIFGLLSQAQVHIENGYYTEAFNIASAVAPECINAIKYIDDSDGECGSAIEEAFSCVNTIAGLATNDTLRQAISRWATEQFQNPDYSDYGCDEGLEDLFFGVSKMMGNLEEPYAIIEKKIKMHANADNGYRDYDYEKYLKYKIDLLKYEGKFLEAEQIIDENIELYNFRQIRVNEELAKNEYQAAIKLLKEGIVISERDGMPGITKRWKEQLLEIYRKTNNTGKVRDISRELFLDNTYSISDYLLYKSTFPEEEWTDACNKLIEQMKPKKKNHYFSAFASDLAAVYVEEKMWPELFSIVKQSGDIGVVAEYTKYLDNDFTPDLILLYEKGITKMAENTGRDIYHTLVVYLKKLASLKGGKEVAVSLKNQLLETYKNRPAMKDEFKLLKW